MIFSGRRLSALEALYSRIKDGRGKRYSLWYSKCRAVNSNILFINEVGFPMIKNAFTESKLTEELWMKIPQGVKSTKQGTAMHLLRSLYGLKQSARDWNLLMKSELYGNVCTYRSARDRRIRTESATI